MAVGTGDAAAGMDALAPQLELRVLRLENRRAGLLVLVVVETLALGQRESVQNALPVPLSSPFE